MKSLQKIELTAKQKKFIDNLVFNAYTQGFRDGFARSGKQFNGISGMLKSKDFEEISNFASESFMKDNEEFFKQYYKIK